MRIHRIAASATALACVLSIFVVSQVSNGAASTPSYLAKMISIQNSAGLTATEVSRISNIAKKQGAEAYAVRFPALGMKSISRGTKVLRKWGADWREPTAAVVMPWKLVKAIAGTDIARVIRAGSIAVGKTSSAFWKIKVGDRIGVLDVNDNIKTMRVGIIVDDLFTFGGDFLLGEPIADSIGARSVSRVSIVNFPNWKPMFEALRKGGYRNTDTISVRWSWSPPNPDSFLGLAEFRKIVGAFPYRPVSASGIQLWNNWQGKNIAWNHKFTGVQLTINCNKRIIAPLQRVFTEIAKAGLAKKIDVRNTNRYGGCYSARMNRLKNSFRSVSKHAYGMAIDINTQTNAQGATPTLNCRIVRIFRKHGFAWGGNVVPPDGMHFEWVGERRDRLPYSSRYCPNIVPPTSTTTTTKPTSSTAPDSTISDSTIPDSTISDSTVADSVPTE